MKKDVNTIIEEIYKEDSKAIGDRKLVLLAVWRKQGLNLTQEQAITFLDACDLPDPIFIAQSQKLLNLPMGEAETIKELALQFRSEVTKQKPMRKF